MNALQDSNDSKIKKIRIEVIYDFALIFFSCIHLKHYGTLPSVAVKPLALAVGI